MDYRNRRYFLVTFGGDGLNQTMTRFLSEYNTVKFYSPYNHVKQYNPKTNLKSGKKVQTMRYDGEYKSITGMGYVQQMMSCSYEEAFFIEMDLKELEQKSRFNRFVEVTKDMLGQ